MGREVSGGGGCGDKELEGCYLKWLHETRVGSYATRFASNGQIQSTHFFILIIYRPFTVIPGDRDRFRIDDQSIHTGLA